jgi:hypothetical protein
MKKPFKRYAAIPFLSLLLLLPVLAWAGGGQSTSGRALSDLVDEVEYLVDNDPYFDSTQIVSHLNAAIDDVVWQTGCTEATEQQAVTAGTTEYALSSSYMKVTNVSWLPSGSTSWQTLLRGKPNDLGYLAHEGAEPKYWYERSGFIGVYPLKDTDNTTVTGTSIYVTYVPLLGTFSSSDEVPVPAVLEQPLVFYAAGRCFFRDKQWAAYAQMMNLYSQWIHRYRTEIGEPPRELRPR